MDNEEALEAAKQAYYEAFWVPIQGTRIDDDELAATLLSFAVNEGTEVAVKLLQRVLNGWGPQYGTPLGVDGEMGSGTLRTIQIIYGTMMTHLLNDDLREAQAQHYKDIVKAKPDDARFREGWLSRAGAQYPDLPR
jgi:lysozyme family protein